MKKLATYCAVLIAMTSFMTACAARQKTQTVQISTVDNKSTNTMKSVKCAIQQAGWNITFADSDSVSATKASGMDNVPITLNIRLEEQQNNTTKAIFTVGSPRGVYGNGDYYSKDVVNALQNCGARGLVITAK
jgi:ABC-type proline/glycine betaine transport system substrate-binding protein